MNVCGKTFLFVLLMVMASSLTAQQNNFLSDLTHFENFRRGNSSIDLSVLAINPISDELDYSIQSSVGGNISYRVMDWSYNARFQVGLHAYQNYTFTSYVNDTTVNEQFRNLGFIRYLSLGVDRKLFQIGHDFFVDAGISVFGINRENGIGQAEKSDLEDNGISYDKSLLQFDFGMGLSLEATLYLHRYFGVVGGVNFDNTLRDLGNNWASYFVGFKFYVK